MTERPILFSGPMVRAILAGEKTQTRRVVKWRPTSPGDVSATRPPDEAVPYTHITGAWLATWHEPAGTSREPTPSPYGLGDHLWVRETWRGPAALDGASPTEIGLRATAAGYASPWAPVWYDADGAFNGAADRVEATHPGMWAGPGRPRPSIHMPRWASRITLRVESVRVERVQAITTEDVIAEGLSTTLREHDAVVHLREQFAELWDSLNARRAAWADNPWVWVVGFSRVTP